MTAIIVDTAEDTVADDGFTSLREALALAQASIGADTINFASTVSTIALNSALTIAAGEDVTINGDRNGDGVADVTIAGSGTSHHFTIAAGATATLQSLGFVQGNASGSSATAGQAGAAGADVFGEAGYDGGAGGNGGAAAGSILNYGTLSVERAYFLNNVGVGASGGTGGQGGAGDRGGYGAYSFTGPGGTGGTGGDGGDGGDGGNGGNAAGAILNMAGASLTLTDTALNMNTALGGGGGNSGSGGRGGTGGTGAEGHFYFEIPNIVSFPGGNGGNGGNGGTSGNSGNTGEAATILNFGSMTGSGAFNNNFALTASAGLVGSAGLGGDQGSGGYSYANVSGSYGALGANGTTGVEGANAIVSETLRNVGAGSGALEIADTQFYIHSPVLDMVESTGNTTVTFYINRIGLTTEAGTVAWALQPTSTTLQAADFVGGVLPSGMAQFTADGPNSVMVTLQLANDSFIEGTETFDIVLTGLMDPEGGALQGFGTRTASFAVTDDDEGPAYLSLFGHYHDTFDTEILPTAQAGIDGFGAIVQLAQGQGAIVVTSPETVGNVGAHTVYAQNLTLIADAGFYANLTLAAGVTSFAMIGSAAVDVTGDADMIGNDGANVLTGGASDNMLSGGDGADRILGLAGDDYLYGDAGNDTLQGGAGYDNLRGGDGRDTADYSDQVMRVNVDLGIRSTQFVGIGAGHDDLVGIEDLQGGSAGDRLVGDTLSNTLSGLGGDDNLFGLDGADVLSGGTGNDGLYGGAGHDVLNGGAGDDRLFGGTGDDILNGGDGFDFADYRSASGGVRVDLRITTAQAVGGGEGIDTLASIENLSGSGYADRLVGDGAGNVLYGLEGNDSIYGLDGTDRISGGAGADRMWGGSGADVFFFHSTADSNATNGQDSIHDFRFGGADMINLAAIDADTTIEGNQAFSFIGTDSFTGAGQVRFVTLNGNGFVLADVDGDGAADMNIALVGITSMTAADFIL